MKELLQYFGISQATLGNWIKEFSAYFDAGVHDRPRRYSEQSILILATINELSKAGYQYSGIHERLKAGYRVADLPQVIQVSDRQLIATDTAKAVAELHTANERIRFLENELDKSKAALEAERDKRIQDIERLHERIAELRYEIGRLSNDKT